jgi:hypothetical protein
MNHSFPATAAHSSNTTTAAIEAITKPTKKHTANSKDFINHQYLIIKCAAMYPITIPNTGQYDTITTSHSK